MDNADIKTERIHLQKMMLVPSSAQDPSSGYGLMPREVPRTLQGNILHTNL